MARLRVRVELNRGGAGIPLHKLAGVVEEARRFFEMLAEDVRIEKNRGEWLAFDLDNSSLNFTAEYVGPVTPEQARAFYAAFDGVTALRRATLAQFTRIAEAIGADEIIGFGFYPSDQESEPGEWRCLSRQDALRISDEVRILQEAAGDQQPEAHLRAAIDSGRGARLFKERHDRSAAAGEHGKWSSFVRAVESNLANRITRLENQVETHSGMIRELQAGGSTAEASAPSFSSASPETSRRRWSILVLFALVLLGIAAAAFLFWTSRNVVRSDRATAAGRIAPPVATQLLPAPEPPKPEQSAREAAPAAGSNGPQANQAGVAPPGPSAAEPVVMHIDLEARAPCWVRLIGVDGNTLLERNLEPNEMRSFDITGGATLRAGNAGAVVLRFNGEDVGPLGPAGKVRDIDFKPGTFKIRAPIRGQAPGGTE